MIQSIFDGRWDGQSLSGDLVTFADIVSAIDATNVKLSRSNPANFWKDIIRKNPNNVWPAAVFAAGYTGEDAIGAGGQASFRFVKFSDGRQQPFLPAPSPSANDLSNATKLQSLAIPLVARRFGRPGENWIAQVVAELGIIQQHFAVSSQLQPRALEVSFVQTGIKLRHGEVDALFRIIDEEEGSWMVAVEMKGRSDEVWEQQVRRSAEALFDAAVSRGLELSGIVPMAVKVQGIPRDRCIIHVIEYEIFDPAKPLLAISSESTHELVPPVPGV